MQSITDLQQQKKNKRRYSVFLDGAYAFSVSDELVVHFHLHKGLSLEQNRLVEILQEDERKSALAKAMDYLGYGARTVKQMGEYLRKKGFSPESADAALKKLLEYRMLDDGQYARDFITCKSGAGLGSQAIKYKLLEKGIAKSIIEEALESHCDEDAQLESAKEWVRKYTVKYADLRPGERRAKLGQALARRGYGWDIIREAISTEEQEEESP